METKHTPGPWQVLSGSIYESKANEGLDCTRIALMDRANFKIIPTERDANARLIAAAPDMLEALTAAKARINGEWDNPSLVKFGPLGTETDDVLTILSTAIVKAEGK